MQGRKQIGRDQCEKEVFPIVCPERIEFPEADTAAGKTLTVLKGSCNSGYTVSKSALDVSELSSWNDDGVIVSEYSAEKLRSLSEGELQTKAEVGEESIVQTHGEPNSRG